MDDSARDEVHFWPWACMSQERALAGWFESSAGLEVKPVVIRSESESVGHGNDSAPMHHDGWAGWQMQTLRTTAPRRSKEIGSYRYRWPGDGQVGTSNGY